MAEQIIPVGYAKATFRFTGDAVNFPANVTMGINNGEDLTAAELATGLADAMTNRIMPDISNQLLFESILVKLGPNDVGSFAQLDVGEVGGASLVNVPPQVALCVQKVTSAGGRANRGRLYMPGLPRAATNEQGEVLSANLVTLQADWQDFWDDVNVGAQSIVVLHSAAGTPTEVTEFNVEALLATQRRRQRRS
jgi:hypothetical protein